MVVGGVGGTHAQGGLSVAQLGVVGVVQGVGPGARGDGDGFLVSLSELDINARFAGCARQAHDRAAGCGVDHQRAGSRLSCAAKQDLSRQRRCQHIFGDGFGDAVAGAAGRSGYHINGRAHQCNVGGIEPVVPVIAFDPCAAGGRAIKFDADTGAGRCGAREQHACKFALLVDHNVATVAVYAQGAGAQGGQSTYQLPPGA